MASCCKKKRALTALTKAGHHDLAKKLFIIVGDSEHLSGPSKLDEYYEPCMDRYSDKEYCARVAWNIYCTHVDPSYKGCSEYGSKWGAPYSKPKSKK